MFNPIWHLSTVGDYQREPAREAPRPTGEGVYDRRHLEDRLERLALICMAMWSLIQSKTDLTEDDLLQCVREIDLMDGVADGKITHQVCRCGTCDRPMSSRHTRCIYCGGEQLIASAFDSV
ncbi:MAG: hypothetical protein ACYTAU_03735 [Planctomycetota bacterium]|jgi:hypothetical protein